MNKLFDTVQLAGHTLKNRIVMPPMTRSRSSQPGDIANELMADYYAQRASAGLIISEGTQISALGKGYAWTPGIYTAEQIAGWKKVTDKVHQAGGVCSLSFGMLAEYLTQVILVASNQLRHQRLPLKTLKFLLMKMTNPILLPQHSHAQ